MLLLGISMAYFLQNCGHVILSKVTILNTTTTDKQKNTSKESENQDVEGLTWGPWVFRAVFVASLVFAWWLVIYDHGVASVHG